MGLKNYITLFSTDLPKYFGNTLLLWIIGFIPQIAVSLLLAAWFTDLRLKLRSADFLKFDMGKVYMLVAIAILPVIVVYLLLSKFIVRGVALGGVKG